jgi:hypothetical protein
VMLGACKGLTLTREQNIDASGTRTTATATEPELAEEFCYPRNIWENAENAQNIHVDQSITIAFDGFVAGETLHAGTGIITVACTPIVGDTETRTFRATDNQVRVSTYTPQGNGASAALGFATITPWKPWCVGTITVTYDVDAFLTDSPNGPISAAGATAVTGTTYEFVTQASCEDLIKTTCTAGGRIDCMWTGSACEAEVVEVAGSTTLLTSASQAAAWGGTAGSNGIQFVADGIGAGTAATADSAPLSGCVNGPYTSRGMYNGKPVYSQDWSVPVEHGGSRLQYELVDPLNGFRSTDAGWVLVCGGGPRHSAAVATTHVTAAHAWTAVTEWSAGTITVTQATCVEPTTKTGYSFPVAAAGDWTRGAFAPTGISCASGYHGSAVPANCDAAGGEITVSGCSKNSRRRRRKHKHNRHWHNNDAAAPFDPFWWFR